MKPKKPRASISVFFEKAMAHAAGIAVANQQTGLVKLFLNKAEYLGKR
jgi:hypothetical protein